jgi:Uma2 family endonuclease
MKPLKKYATYADLCAVPENFVAEIFDGELYATPRPAPPHVHANSVLGMKLGAFHRSGPGGWFVLDEPELHFGSDVLVPDIGGWRRERMPETPHAAFFTLAPDWVCEVLSPSTARLDKTRKLWVYARERVSHVWFVEPIEQTLEVLRLDGDIYKIVLTAGAEDRVRAEPFDAIELDLAILWAR